MTLAEVKAMLAPGTRWHATTPYKKTTGPRTVLRVMSKQIVWTTEQSTSPLYMDLPTAAQLLEARDGFVKWHLFAQGELMPEQHNPTITLARQESLSL